MKKNTEFNENTINQIMRNSLTNDCLEFLKILNDNGFESFAVGGCVRDCLLGNSPKDEDLTTNATPEQVREVFSNIKGISVWDSGLKHGTVTVVKGNTSIEITTYRSDGEYSDGRRPDSVIFEDSIDKDLARRDFTINALAWSPRDGFKDNYNGLNDLQNGIIRAVGDANARISEDALRMMRAIRFSARYGFDIEDSLIEAIKDNSQSLSNVSNERIRDELCKTLMTENPNYIRKFYELGLMKEISPEINNLFSCEQNSKYHLYNVGDHSLKTLEISPKDLKIRVALLLHDVGKPAVKSINEKTGFDQFINHADASEIIAKEILKNLRFSSEEVRDISNMVKFHDFLLTLPNNPKKIHSKLRDFIINHSELEDSFYSSFVKINECDIYGQNPTNLSVIEKNEMLNIVKKELESILSGPHRTKDLAINGNNIMTIQKEDKNGILNVCKGPAIREMQKILLREIINNPEKNTKENLMELCERNVIQANLNVEISKEKKLSEENHMIEISNKVEKYLSSLEYNKKDVIKLSEKEIDF